MPWGSGGVPCQVQPGGGTLPGGVPWPGGYPGQVPPPARLGWGVPCWGVPWPGGYPGQVPPPARSGWGGTLVRYPPSQVRMGGYPAGGGYPGRTTEGVLTTRRAVCLLRSRRRTFLFFRIMDLFPEIDGLHSIILNVTLLIIITRDYVNVSSLWRHAINVVIISTC